MTPREVSDIACPSSKWSDCPWDTGGEAVQSAYHQARECPLHLLIGRFCLFLNLSCGIHPLPREANQCLLRFGIEVSHPTKVAVQRQSFSYYQKESSHHQSQSKLDWKSFHRRAGDDTDQYTYLAGMPEALGLIACTG